MRRARARRRSRRPARACSPGATSLTRARRRAYFAIGKRWPGRQRQHEGVGREDHPGAGRALVGPRFHQLVDGCARRRAPRARRSRRSRSRKPRSPIACADHVVAGSMPRASLCSALRAAFEARDAVREAVLDRLVVARLEVQARHVLDRAPVAAPHRRAVGDVERRADAARRRGGRRPSRCGRRAPRRCARTRRASGRASSGARGRSPCSSGRRTPSRRRRSSPPSLRSNATPRSASLRRSCRIFLRLSCENAARKSSKSRQPAFDQWNWTPRRRIKPARLELLRLRGGDEQQVQRRMAARRPTRRERGRGERPPRRRVVAEQARAGHRRERHGGDELRVVRAAVAAVGVGPAPVEDVLAVRMRLRVERQRADQRVAATTR